MSLAVDFLTDLYEHAVHALYTLPTQPGSTKVLAVTTLKILHKYMKGYLEQNPARCLRALAFDLVLQAHHTNAHF